MRGNLFLLPIHRNKENIPSVPEFPEFSVCPRFPHPLPRVVSGSVDSKRLADTYLGSVDSNGLIGALTDSIGLQVVYTQRLNKK
jgi:hypothetical protein